MCLLAGPSSIGSQESVGSNTCLLLACWQMLPLGLGLQLQHFVPCLRLGTWLAMPWLWQWPVSLSCSLWDHKLQSCPVAPLTLWPALVVARQARLPLGWGVHRCLSSHLQHSGRWFPAICYLVALEGPCGNYLLPLREAQAFPWTSSAVLY